MALTLEQLNQATLEDATQHCWPACTNTHRGFRKRLPWPQRPFHQLAQLKHAMVRRAERGGTSSPNWR
jgi:hypothetical protein